MSGAPDAPQISETGGSGTGAGSGPDSGPGSVDEVPKLPRGRGLRLSRPEIFRVVGLAALLVFMLATQRTCATSVSRFVTSYDNAPSVGAPPVGAPTAGAPSAGAGSANAPDVYERLRPGMTDAEMRAAIERARVRAAGSAAQ